MALSAAKRGEIMGYSYISDPNSITPLWKRVQTTNDPDNHRTCSKDAMTVWAERENEMIFKKNITLKDVIVDMVKGGFCPGRQNVAEFKITEKSMSALLVMPWDP